MFSPVRHILVGRSHQTRSKIDPGDFSSPVEDNDVNKGRVLVKESSKVLAKAARGSYLTARAKVAASTWPLVLTLGAP
jgi:hypothetical protein